MVELRGVLLVEVEATDLPGETLARGRREADFLRVLAERADVALALAVAVGTAVERIVHRRAAIGIAAAVARGRLVRADRSERDRPEVIGSVHRRAVGVVILRVVVALVERDAVARFGRDRVRALLQRRAVEDRRGAVIAARMARHVDRESVGRRQQDLQAHVLFGEAAHRILLRRARAVGAVAGEGVVDPVVAMLHQARQTNGDLVSHDRAADAGVIGEGAEAAGRRRHATLPGLRRLDRVELNDTGGRVATEQGPLRTAQDFDLLYVEHGIRLQDDMLQNNIVLDDGNWLAGAQVKVYVAQTADVEAREDAAGGGFGIEAGDAARERENVFAARLEIAQFRPADDGDRDRHALQVFGPAFGGDDDVAEIAGVGLRRGVGRGGNGRRRRLGEGGRGEAGGAEQQHGLEHTRRHEIPLYGLARGDHVRVAGARVIPFANARRIGWRPLRLSRD